MVSRGDTETLDPQTTFKEWSAGDKKFYARPRERPEKAAIFQILLTMYASDCPTCIPAAELVGTWRNHTTLLQEVGGERGHDLRVILELHCSDPNGALIIQKLLQAVQIAMERALERRITPAALDFFTTQPVKWERAYHLHLVLFDCP